MNRVLIFLAAAFVLAVSACGNPTPATDAGSTESEARYLVLGSYLAEIMVELGDGDKIVGVGGGADHIESLAHVPVIPGYRNMSAESMLSLNPTVAVLDGRMTHPDVVGQLEAAGLKIHFFPQDASSLSIIPERIREMGQILGREIEADALVAGFEADLMNAMNYVSHAKTRPRGMFILSGGARPIVVAGEGTHTAFLLELAGAENVGKGFEGHKPMSQEAMVEAAPDFILINEEGFEDKGGVPVALTAPGAMLTPAGQNGNVFSMPGEYLQGLGLYTPTAIRAIAAEIHPDLESEE